MGGEVILIDISIPEPGAYWLNAQKVDSKTFCFRTAKDKTKKAGGFLKTDFCFSGQRRYHLSWRRVLDRPLDL